jgi:hypothetical protein
MRSVILIASFFENGYWDGGGVNNLEAKKRLGALLFIKRFNLSDGITGKLGRADIL